MRASEKKCKKMESRALPSSGSSAECSKLISFPWNYNLRPSVHHLENEEDENSNIPKDVPKGHMVVYVGKKLKRYVIKITLLKHPLFRALLDQARDEYGFTTTSKLCIPCDENMFLDVVQCASSPQDKRIRFCL